MYLQFSSVTRSSVPKIKSSWRRRSMNRSRPHWAPLPSTTSTSSRRISASIRYPLPLFHFSPLPIQRPTPTITTFTPLLGIKCSSRFVQVIHPPDTKPVGFFKTLPVYPRKNLATLHTAERWLQEGMQIKAGGTFDHLAHSCLPSFHHHSLLPFTFLRMVWWMWTRNEDCDSLSSQSTL